MGIVRHQRGSWIRMRPGQNRRMRGRNRNNNNSKGPNPLTRSFESNGPDVKIRGTAQHIAEKYSQLARDAQASGDPVAAENYSQHAEHYFRIISAAQEQFRQQSGQYNRFDEDGEDGEEEAGGNGFSYQNGDRGEAYGEEIDPAMQPQPYEYRSGGEQQQREPRQPRQFRDDRRDDRNDRGDRNDRHTDRYERTERTERTERADRSDRGDRNNDRPERGERRSRFLRRDRQPGVDGERRHNRRDDDRRHEAPLDADGQNSPTNALPAFLTAPIRTPVSVTLDEPEAPVLPLVEEEAPAPRPRRRRTTKAAAAEAPAKSTEPVGD